MRVRLWPLVVGLVLLLGLWAGPLPERARVSFSAHMILHLSVMLGAAPLLALGFARLRRMPRNAPWIWVAVPAALVELGVVWGWHAPALHEAAALVPWIFALQQLSFLGAGIAVWLPGLAASGRAGAGAGALAMLMSFMHMSMLGVLLTTAPGLIYPPELCLGAFGPDPIDDQRLGGVLMAIGGGTPYLAGGIAFAHRFIAEPVHRPNTEEVASRG